MDYEKEALYLIEHGYVPKNTNVEKLTEMIRSMNNNGRLSSTFINDRNSVYGEDSNIIEELKKQKNKEIIREFNRNLYNGQVT